MKKCFEMKKIKIIHLEKKKKQISIFPSLIFSHSADGKLLKC